MDRFSLDRILPILLHGEDNESAWRQRFEENIERRGLSKYLDGSVHLIKSAPQSGNYRSTSPSSVGQIGNVQPLIAWKEDLEEYKRQQSHLREIRELFWFSVSPFAMTDLATCLDGGHKSEEAKMEAREQLVLRALTLRLETFESMDQYLAEHRQIQRDLIRARMASYTDDVMIVVLLHALPKTFDIVKESYRMIRATEGIRPAFDIVADRLRAVQDELNTPAAPAADIPKEEKACNFPKCGRLGHLESECWFKYPELRPHPTRSETRSEPRPEVPGSLKVCTFPKCGKSGHLESQCWVKHPERANLVCTCGKTGHSESECWFNPQRSSPSMPKSSWRREPITPKNDTAPLRHNVALSQVNALLRGNAIPRRSSSASLASSVKKKDTANRLMSGASAFIGSPKPSIKDAATRSRSTTASPVNLGNASSLVTPPNARASPDVLSDLKHSDLALSEGEKTPTQPTFISAQEAPETNPSSAWGTVPSPKPIVTNDSCRITKGLSSSIWTSSTSTPGPVSPFPNDGVDEPKTVDEPHKVVEQQQTVKPKGSNEQNESVQPKGPVGPKEPMEPKEPIESKESVHPKEMGEPNELGELTETDEAKESDKQQDAIEQKEPVEQMDSVGQREIETGPQTGATNGLTADSVDPAVLPPFTLSGGDEGVANLQPLAATIDGTESQYSLAELPIDPTILSSDDQNGDDEGGKTQPSPAPTNETDSQYERIMKKYFF